MKKLQPLLETFQDSILARDDSKVLADIRVNPRLSPAQQMAIYTEGYRLRLLAAVRSDYPALLAYLGEAAFDAAVLAYIEATPSTFYNLDKYPHAFAPFFAAHTKEPFAAELAALEAAIAEIFIAPESPALESATLKGITAEAFGELVLVPRAASRLLAFAHPVSGWLNEQRKSSLPPPAPSPQTEYIFAYRHQNEVCREPLSQPAYLLLEELAKGAPVGQALENVINAHPQHMDAIAGSLQLWFSYWVSLGFFTQNS